jgi:TonB family protein
MSPVLDAVVRSSIVLAIGLLGVWVLRKQPASLRHWVLAAAIALAVAQPVVNQVVPSLQIPTLGWSSDPAVAEPSIETTFTFEPIVPRVTAPPVQSIDWARVAFVVWAAGAAVSLVILLSGALWLSWLGWKSAAADQRWHQEMEDLRRQLGFGKRVRVLITDHPAMLVTWGAIAPVILLPADANQWPIDRIRLVLAHETAHLIRRDWMIQLAAELVRAINWFNPLFWLASARLRSESEYACDDIVLDLGIGGTSYASHLVDLARTFSVHGRTWLPAPSIARPSTLERRVRAMLNPQVNRRPVSNARRAVLAIVLLVIALPIAAATQGPPVPSGTIVDPSGRALPDAIVRLTAIGSDAAFETRTDANGAFEFSPVPQGDYLLSARSPGFSTMRQRLALSGGGVTITLKLPVGTLSERVSVGGGKSDGDGPRTQQLVTNFGPEPCSPSTTGQITPPMKLKDVRPRYKQAWLDNKIEGNVLLRAHIGVDGRVRNVDVISGVNVELEDEAIGAVSQWEFSPTYLNCEPTEVQMYVTVAFKAE